LPKEVLPEGPRSSFLVVRCNECGNEQTVFSHVASKVNCKMCNATLAESSGGKSIIKGQIVRVLT
jgi:small subunit ribosomal protein S27e